MYIFEDKEKDYILEMHAAQKHINYTYFPQIKNTTQPIPGLHAKILSTACKKRSIFY